MIPLFLTLNHQIYLLLKASAKSHTLLETPNHVPFENQRLPFPYFLSYNKLSHACCRHNSGLIQLSYYNPQSLCRIFTVFSRAAIFLSRSSINALYSGDSKYLFSRKLLILTKVITAIARIK